MSVFTIKCTECGKETKYWETCTNCEKDFCIKHMSTEEASEDITVDLCNTCRIALKGIFG